MAMINYTDFDVNSIVLKKPKQLQFNNIWDIKDQSNKPILILTPKLRLSMGIFAIDFSQKNKFPKGRRVDRVENATKVTLPLSVDLPGPDGESQKFLDVMDAIDTKIKQLLYDNIEDTSKDARFVKQNLPALYVSPVQPSDQYPALFCPRVNINEERIVSQFFDENGTFIPEPMKFIQQHSLAKVVVQLDSVSQQTSSNKFYVNMKVIQAKVFPQASDTFNQEMNFTCMI